MNRNWVLVGILAVVLTNYIEFVGCNSLLMTHGMRYRHDKAVAKLLREINDLKVLNHAKPAAGIGDAADAASMQPQQARWFSEAIKYPADKALVLSQSTPSLRLAIAARLQPAMVAHYRNGNADGLVDVAQDDDKRVNRPSSGCCNEAADKAAAQEPQAEGLANADKASRDAELVERFKPGAQSPKGHLLAIMARFEETIDMLNRVRKIAEKRDAMERQEALARTNMATTQRTTKMFVN